MNKSNNNSVCHRIWQYLLTMDCLVSVKQIASALNISDNHCRNVLNTFVAQQCATKHGKRGSYTFAAIPAAKPRLKPGRATKAKKQYKKSGRQKIWNTLKMQRVVAIEDLVCLAGVTATNAQKYITSLIKAGYVKPKFKVDTRKANSTIKGERSTYCLIRDTGRQCPIARKDGCWDQNEQRLYQFNHKEKGSERVA